MTVCILMVLNVQLSSKLQHFRVGVLGYSSNQEVETLKRRVEKLILQSKWCLHKKKSGHTDGECGIRKLRRATEEKAYLFLDSPPLYY